MKILRVATISLALLILAVAATAFGALRLALPIRSGTHGLPGLAQSVTIRFDESGAPHIAAANREDAFAVLGYVTAGDRLFQMDLLRRKSAGRLAEVFGPALLESDRFARTMNFDRLADAILERLPDDETRALDAYARGVQQAMRDAVVKPWELLALGYDPEPWRPRDSILVALTFAHMSSSIESERAATVMRAALPAAVVDFLTPESDCYNEALAPRSPERCAAGARLPEELRPLLRAGARASRGAAIVGVTAPGGSNAWAISRARTADGRAILASDMHLFLQQPNVWYRAHLAYGDVAIEGLTYPGAPLVVVGSNGRVAWGLTNLDADFTDLVRLRPAGEDGTKYATAEGPRDYSIRRERISVRGGEDALLDIKETVFGPVLPDRLLGDETALRWTMLDPAATNLDLMNMDRAVDARSALRILQGVGVPPLNAIVADAGGSIGWTLIGKIPKRRGFSGRFAEFWDDGGHGWDGYFSHEELPVVVDPPEGFIVSANQRMLGRAAFAPEIGHDYSGGVRAWRIAERLRSGAFVEADMATLQLDSSAEYYRYDRDVALEALRASKIADAETDDLQRALEAFDGRAEPGSVGLRLVFEFRSELKEAVLSPILERCRALDPKFRYFWSNADTSVRAMIDARRAESDREEWNGVVVAALRRAAARLRATSGATSVAGLRWGEENRVQMFHPLSSVSSLLAPFLDMPKAEVAGCPDCVRFHAVSQSGNGVGANARLVASPGHEEDGLFQMAGGQSGQPASPHYADRHADWVAGRSRPFRARSFESELVLEPAKGAP